MFYPWAIYVFWIKHEITLSQHVLELCVYEIVLCVSQMIKNYRWDLNLATYSLFRSTVLDELCSTTNKLLNCSLSLENKLCFLWTLLELNILYGEVNFFGRRTFTDGTVIVTQKQGSCGVLWAFFLVLNWSHLEGINLIIQGEDLVSPFCKCHKNWTSVTNRNKKNFQ